MIQDELVVAARTAMARAYAPYSKFKVGAALQAKSGRVYIGCNVENVSFGLTVCAERSALAAAVTAGEREFVRLVIVTSRRKAASPCGACRQVLAEFGVRLEVLLVEGTRLKRFRLRELLPELFRMDRL